MLKAIRAGSGVKTPLEFLLDESGGIGIMGRRRGRHFIGSNISSSSPPSNTASVFFFQDEFNAYPADLYGSTYKSNFNLIT